MPIKKEPMQMEYDPQDRIFQFVYIVRRRDTSLWSGLEKKKTRSNPVSTICTKWQSPAPFKQVNALTKDEEKNPFISEGCVSLGNSHDVATHLHFKRYWSNTILVSSRNSALIRRDCHWSPSFDTRRRTGNK